ncbi:Biotin carboxyl carrier protein of acetyl-CoA carboxylase [Candidatus Westeberhardia cardiocondylae]|uniref:Biotin carboxyl carrier protein of acetyl-CoA carboxylase n=1 Tax=Candidatus Westeberhardia cardiocondylae TaxID=1594731 RepID=A0A0H5BX68_9ENTR|nr:acetyl-CoA carboxylase biotin carboxyl carrier protein [Candidatus Westeberhardia cardiocondylae]MCR3756325.1 biotin carboxyl carrier protein [Candidatus Westeberhardia cardiocondylae]CEN32303.1 Biotin carboxyl carrier protein of acetyl-CoA carboxylase [Candidatus Westeberhardia cardiocondylae]
MDIRKIKRLIKLIEESSVSELEFSQGKDSIRISRFISNSYDSIIRKRKNFLSKKNKDIVPKFSVLSDLKENTKSISSNFDIDGHIIRSPMVGTFYRAACPNSKPFVEIGEEVNVGDTLFIIEAMKMMHRIQSDKSGVVQIIFLNDGQPVEFDEPLIVIK